MSYTINDTQVYFQEDVIQTADAFELLFEVNVPSVYYTTMKKIHHCIMPKISTMSI